MRQSDTTPPSINISPHVEEALRNVVLKHAGIVLQNHQLNNLRDTVRMACDHFGYTSARDFLHALNALPVKTAEIEYLIAGVTVGESYFFRDEEQIRFLREVCLPDLIARKRRNGSKMLRIWSAGCANGQEIYTMAILLREQLPDLDDWTLHLLGTDINTASLAQAVRGRYSKWSFRATPPPICKQYFTHRGNEFVLKPTLRKLARFTYLNLSHDSFPSIQTNTHSIDLLLCRNVFIYFDPEHIKSVMTKFADCLAQKGYLLLGAADHVPTTTGLDYRHMNNVQYYIRAGAGSRDEAHTVATEAVPVHRPQPHSQDHRPKATRQPSSQSQTTAKQDRQQQAIDQMIADLHTGRWARVIVNADNCLQKWGGHALVLQFKAKAEANLGLLESAADLCEQSLALDPMEKRTYLIKGMVMMELNQPDKAEAALRRGIYLDHDFTEAYYHLGILLLQRGQQKAGIKQLHNARELAENSDPGRLVHNAADMTFGRFAEILRNEIEMYQQES